MRAFLAYCDLIGGIFGIIGSIVLGYPLITEITDRLQWDLLRQYKERQIDALSDPEIEAYRNLRDRLIDNRLGQHDRYRRFTICGFISLLAAFVFTTIASYERAWPTAAPSEHAANLPPSSAH
jgi:hypothetical protein